MSGVTGVTVTNWARMGRRKVAELGRIVGKWPFPNSAFFQLYHLFSRTSVPTFAPFVVSACGELAPKAYDLQEWLVTQYKRKCSKDGRRSDGWTTAELARRFRHSLKMGVQTAVAAGIGTMIQTAGQSWRGLGPAQFSI